MTKAQPTTKLYDLESTTMGMSVPMSVVLPPGYDSSESLPLLIRLHGGGEDRAELIDSLPIFEEMWTREELPPLVMVSFSSGPGSWYGGAWEQFVVDELPRWANEQFNTRLDREGTVMTGVSMGGYGSLKIGFKNPHRFRAIAPLEPAIEPSLERTPGHRRNTWYRMEDMETLVWGSPLDEAAWLADNPATIARDNADAIGASGLEIYLEVGDKDYINLHDGAEFMHRVLWDHDIRHEYHLVRWADHVGRSLDRRLAEAHRFLAAALAGGLDEPIDLPLADDEQAYINWINGGAMTAGEPPPDPDFKGLSDPERAPSVHRHIWDPLRDGAAGDPAMKRAYAELPRTR